MTHKQKRLKNIATGLAISITALALATPASAGPNGSQEFDWSGFYLGAHTDYSFSKGKDIATAKTLKSKTFDLGLHTGYNIQWDSMILGFEADINPLTFSKNKNLTGAITRAHFQPLATTRLRMGYAMDRALLFGTGGLSFGSGSLKGGGKKSDKMHVGWVLGGGMEYAVNNNWILRAQYLYHNYGKAKNYKLLPTARKVKYNAAHTLSLGVSYKF